MEKTYCIYCHTNKINGKKYIGQTGGDLQKRFGENGYSYRKQMFGRAIKKYGWDNFEHTVLEQGLTLEEAKIKISKASKMRGNPNKGKKWFNNGIISTMANECPKGWSEGRLSMKEETKEKLRQCNLGKKHSEETKAKMSKVRKIYLNKEVA